MSLVYGSTSSLDLGSYDIGGSSMEDWSDSLSLSEASVPTAPTGASTSGLSTLWDQIYSGAVQIGSAAVSQVVTTMTSTSAPTQPAPVVKTQAQMGGTVLPTNQPFGASGIIAIVAVIALILFLMRG